MSLLVWLPLIANTDNYGLLPLPSPWESRSKETGGKIGQYCYTDRAIYHLTDELLSNQWSIMCWVKSTGWSANNDIILCKNSSESTNSQFYFSIINGTSLNLGINGGSANGAGGKSYAFATNTWYHVAATYNGTNYAMYVNGEKIKSGTYSSTMPTGLLNLCIGCRSTNAAGTTSTGNNNKRLNDVRIYNKALSPLEIKRIAQGLILHYPLNDNSIQQMNNCYNYPTFNTSTASGGWYHWGSSGHAGNYGQTTDKKYIYRSDQTYAHWVADGSEGTHNYLLYQYPEFEGGFRSLAVICKEENGLEINESICYPAWNSRNGGAVANKWTSITPLGNGFYLCKCEGISQNGSDDLVGIYIRIGYKVYFSECYLENNRTICSDFIFNNLTIYDTSGYCYNGNITGSLIMSPGIARYKTSTYFNGNSYIQSIFNTGISGDLDFTVSFWINADAFTSDYAAVVWNGYSGTNQAIAICVPGGKVSLDFWNNRYLTNSVVLTPNNWYHVCCTKKAGAVSTSNSHIYINGQEVTGTANNYSSTAPNISGNYKWIIGRLNDTASRYITGKISDIRIYATALSADDVKALYENSAYIANNGTMYTYEFIEE